jgi:hypothetical protein
MAEQQITPQGQERPVLQELKCPTCGSPVKQHIPDAQTLVCTHCHSHLNIGGMDGVTASRGVKLPHPRVPVEIGQKVTLNGVQYFVMGRVMYQGWEPDDPEDHWTWNEWLLGANDGRMVWMSHDTEDGFMLFNKLRSREAFDPQNSATIPVGGGKNARVEERYPAKILGAEGELSWRATRGDRLYMVEGSGDGKSYSVQVTPNELEIYEGEPLSQQAAAVAFGEEAMQKFKVQTGQQSGGLGRMIGIVCIAFAIAAAIIGFGASGTGQMMLSQQVTLSSAQPAVSIPIDFVQTQRPVMVQMSVVGSIPENSFADVDMSVVAPNEVESLIVSEEFWHETGVDEGEFWREQDLNGSGEFVPFLAGMHDIELELGTEPPEQLTRVSSVTMQVDVISGRMSPNFLFGYAVIVAVIGLFLTFRGGGSGGMGCGLFIFLAIGGVILLASFGGSLDWLTMIFDAF